ncbi:Hsp33 family molecular chaperone HslO [Marinobacteraceae bacterium S3BR75-40.1]
MTDASDQLHRFIFENGNVRGEHVQLDASLQEALSKQAYSDPQARLLGESLAAVTLLSATLKFEGRLSLQARGDGPVQLLMAECSHQQGIRGLIHGDETPRDGSVPELLGQGRLAITIEPERGQRYQGIVPLESDNLSACLQDYFQRSEQLDTFIVLYADRNQASGLLLQKLPGEASPEADFWNRLTTLAGSVKAEELHELDTDRLLRRLFPEDDVRLYDASPIRFSCSCSRERTLSALEALGQETVYEILAEQGEIEMDCQFCHQQYRYSQQDMDKLFNRPALH